MKLGSFLESLWPLSPCPLTTMASFNMGLLRLGDCSPGPCLAHSSPWKPCWRLHVTQQNSTPTTALRCLFGLHFPPWLWPLFLLPNLTSLWGWQSLQPGYHPACSLSDLCGGSGRLWRVGECSFLMNFSTLSSQCLLINFRCFRLRKNSQVGRWIPVPVGEDQAMGAGGGVDNSGR
jgi:hypothetical protein